MKKEYYLFFILLSLIITSACGGKLEKNQYRLYGKIEGMANGTANIIIPDDTAKRGMRYVNVQFKDGEFEYIGKSESPEVIRMWINDGRVKKTAGRGYFPVKCSLFWFISAPGKEIKVIGNIKDFVNAYPYDGGENNVFSFFMKEAFPVINKQGNIMVEKAVNKELTEDQKKFLDKKLKELGKQEHNIKLKFLKNHISSVAGLWLLEDMIVRSQIKMEKVEGLLSNVKSKYYMLPYYDNLLKRVAGFRSTQVGQIAPNILTKNTYNGEEFNLKSMLGKYTLIDFWGTW